MIDTTGKKGPANGASAPVDLEDDDIHMSIIHEERSELLDDLLQVL